nr:skin secretory protein xP2-like [Setaria viridis]
MRRKDRLSGAQFRKAPGPRPRGRCGAPPQGSARGASQEPARSAPRRSLEPAPAVAQEPTRDVPPESARSAPRRSTEPAPAIAPETRGQRSGDKRAAPRGLVLQLAPKKALRVSSASAGRTAVPPVASGGVPGGVAGPTEEAAPVTATGGEAASSGAGEGVDPAPPSASPVNPSVQSVTPQGPQAGEVIDLDADEAEGTAATGTGTDVPAAAMGTAAATEERVSASAVAAEGVAVTKVGTSAPEVPAEVALAAEAEVPARGAPAGAEEPPSAVAVEGEVDARIPVPSPASEAVTPSGDPVAAPTATGAQAPGPSVNPAASGMKTVKRVRRERQKVWQDRDAEKVQKEEAEKVATDLGVEVVQLQAQARELQASVAQGLDRERQLKAQSEGELTRLREALDAERIEHGALRDAVRVVCDDLGVVVMLKCNI